MEGRQARGRMVRGWGARGREEVGRGRRRGGIPSTAWMTASPLATSPIRKAITVRRPLPGTTTWTAPWVCVTRPIISGSRIRTSTFWAWQLALLCSSYQFRKPHHRFKRFGCRVSWRLRRLRAVRLRWRRRWWLGLGSIRVRQRSRDRTCTCLHRRQGLFKICRMLNSSSLSNRVFAGIYQVLLNWRWVLRDQISWRSRIRVVHS